MNSEDKVRTFADDVESAVLKGTLVNLTFSKFPAGDVQKVKGTLKTLSGINVMQLEYFLSEGRVKQENVKVQSLYDKILSLIADGSKNVQLVTTEILSSILISSKGALNTTRKKNSAPSVFPVIKGNNQSKNYIFNGSENFLIELGISDRNGRVHDKRQAKFRQINRFAEQVRDIVKYLPNDGEIEVYDLCSGKSYLSFAVYYYLTFTLDRRVNMICVDLKKSVMDECASIARRLGYSGMSFYSEDVKKFSAKSNPDLVISLHACDTATDIVIDFAIRNRAKVILSTPCCQHEMFGIMDCPELEFISKYSILKQKIASAATDALRLAKLESAGYKTDAIELIDPDETPKNVLLRGILKSGFSDGAAWEKLEFYNRSYKFMTGVDNNDRN